jgi:RHS repeat-associated protein
MGCHKLTYHDQQRALEANPFFVERVLGKKGYADKNCVSGYRYGFQGQEKDDEVKGAGNSVNFKYRMHDPRLGRFLSIDPLSPLYPWYTPYQFAGNCPIRYVDVEGLEPATPKAFFGENDPIFITRSAWSGVTDKNNPTVYLIHNIYRNGELAWSSGKVLIKQGGGDKNVRDVIITKNQGTSTRWQRTEGKLGNIYFSINTFSRSATGKIFADNESAEFAKDDEGETHGNKVISEIVKQFKELPEPENAFITVTVGGSGISDELRQERGQEIIDNLKSNGVEGVFIINTQETSDFEFNVDVKS